MSLLSFIGLAVGVGAVGYVLNQGGSLNVFLDANSAILVFGGTVGATMITFPWKLVKQVPRSFWRVYFPRKHRNPEDVIDQLMEIQQTASGGGIDEVDLGAIQDPFLRSGIRLLMEEQEEEDLLNELRTESAYTMRRSQQLIDLYKAMGDYAPIFGLLGTLIGVVEVLKHLGDSEKMGQYMALAIVTTFYGIFSTNFFFLPTAGKLEGYAEDGLLIRELITVGMLSIRRKELPTVMRRRLKRYLAQRAVQAGRK